MSKLRSENLPVVRFGSLADKPTSQRNVCCTPESGHLLRALKAVQDWRAAFSVLQNFSGVTSMSYGTLQGTLNL